MLKNIEIGSFWKKRDSEEIWKVILKKDKGFHDEIFINYILTDGEKQNEFSENWIHKYFEPYNPEPRKTHKHQFLLRHALICECGELADNHDHPEIMAFTKKDIRKEV